MSETSSIAILKNDGTVEQIFCYWAGFYESNGAILLLHYRSPKKIKELMSLGDISFLHKEVHPSPGSNHSFSKPEMFVTTSYRRDRGDKDSEVTEFASYGEYLKDGNFQQFDYLFDEKKEKWYVLNPDYRTRDSVTMQREVELLSLRSLVKKSIKKSDLYLQVDLLQYEQELQAQKKYNKLNKELGKTKQVAVSRKIKI